jgi:hypothetical protein
MTSARTVAMALALAAGSISTVRAQAPWPGEPPQPAEAPWPGRLPWPGKPLWQPTSPAPPNSPRKCVAELTALRSQVEKLGMGIKASAKKGLPRDEICKLVTAYLVADIRWLTYADSNMTKCGIAGHIVNQMQTVHAKAGEDQIKLCAAGLSPRDPRDDFRFGPPIRPIDYSPTSLPRISGRRAP